MSVSVSFRFCDMRASFSPAVKRKTGERQDDSAWEV
jgi:hypothetical protein